LDNLYIYGTANGLAAYLKVGLGHEFELKEFLKTFAICTMCVQMEDIYIGYTLGAMTEWVFFICLYGSENGKASYL
jgi:hypothetical protein